MGFNLFTNKSIDQFEHRQYLKSKRTGHILLSLFSICGHLNDRFSTSHINAALESFPAINRIARKDGAHTVAIIRPDQWRHGAEVAVRNQQSVLTLSVNSGPTLTVSGGQLCIDRLNPQPHARHSETVH